MPYDMGITFDESHRDTPLWSAITVGFDPWQEPTLNVYRFLSSFRSKNLDKK